MCTPNNPDGNGVSSEFNTTDSHIKEVAKAVCSQREGLLQVKGDMGPELIEFTL